MFAAVVKKWLPLLVYVPGEQVVESSFQSNGYCLDGHSYAGNYAAERK